MTGTASPRTLSIPRFALRRDEAAASVAISPTLFDEWIRLKRMPKGRKIGGVVLWDTQALFRQHRPISEVGRVSRTLQLRLRRA
jgi:predicted DNA-binding transcriptional regulator AlpA